MMQTNPPTEVIEPIDLGMLEKLREQLSQTVDFAELGIAVGIIFVAIFVAHLVAVNVAKRIAAFTDKQDEDDAPLRYALLLRSASSILRFALLGLLLVIAHGSWDWQFISASLLGLGYSLTLAFSVYALFRALNLGFWTAMAASSALFAFLLSNSIGGITPLSSYLDGVAFQFGTHRLSLLMFVTAILVGIFLVALVRLGNRAVKLLLGRNDTLDDGQRLLGEKLAMVVLVVVAFFVGIDMLGIDLTALAVFSGAFGLAIGFGLQKTFGNLIAGIILLWDRSIKPGDVIALGDTFGWVNKIGIRAVSIITRDGKEHLIPNENLMTNEVENWSYSSKNVRVHIPVGVSYSSDMDRVEDLLMQALDDNKRLLKRPEPKILMKGFGDSSVDFEIRVWIRDPEAGVSNIKSDIYKRIWVLFKKNNIEIPFPQRDLNLRNVPEELLNQTRPEPAAKPKPKKR